MISVVPSLASLGAHLESRFGLCSGRHDKLYFCHYSIKPQGFISFTHYKAPCKEKKKKAKSRTCRELVLTFEDIQGKRINEQKKTHSLQPTLFF